MENIILVVGSSTMAKFYAKILVQLKMEFVVVGRSIDNSNKFTEETGIKCYCGGIESFLLSNKNIKINKAIVTVNVDNLLKVGSFLIKYGIKNILIEKPGGLNEKQINLLNDITISNKASVFVAYNRRFYSSVSRAKEIIDEDGGALSANFEFTEWSHIIESLDSSEEIKNNWFLANSTHVVDLAFYLIGKPIELFSNTSGELFWHKPAVFSGSGKTHKGVLFNYSANWLSAGRWSLEILTKKRKLILCPLEELQEQKKGSIEIHKIEDIDYSIDKSFKPGLYRQTKAFIDDNFNELKTIEEQSEDLNFYNIIQGKSIGSNKST